MPPVRGDGRPVSEIGYDDVQRMALAFALETETWPVFLAWARDSCASAAARAWLAAGPDLAELRREWVQRSDDPIIHALYPH